MSKPIAVIAGDIHYNLKNLELANTLTRMAIQCANELKVPFVANGDTQDQKAMLRAECVNAMIDTFKTAKIKPYVNIGNHDMVNNKGRDHALNFLRPYAHVIETSQYINDLKVYIIPYHDDIEELRSYLKTLPPKSTLILHQGLTGSDMGEYIKDHSALNPDDLKDFTSILSHYHNHQVIKCGDNLATYVGSGYTQSFGEAYDNSKGFGVLYDDGELEFITSNLRRHLAYDLEVNDMMNTRGVFDINKDDLVRIRLSGPQHLLNEIDKQDFLDKFKLPVNTKIEKINTEIIKTTATLSIQHNKFHAIITNIVNSSDRKDSILNTMRQVNEIIVI